MRFFLIPAVLALTVGCDDHDAHSEHGGSMNPDTPPAGDTYVAGLEKMGDNGMLKVRLVDALPAPPDLGDNDWILEVLDMSDTALEGCTIDLEPRMPAHGHGTNKDAEMTEIGAGRYAATPVDLFMPGLWVTAVDIECGDMTDTVTYEFWIEG